MSERRYGFDRPAAYRVPPCACGQRFATWAARDAHVARLGPACIRGRAGIVEGPPIPHDLPAPAARLDKHSRPERGQRGRA